MGFLKPIRSKILSKNNFTCENAVSQSQYRSCKLRVMGACLHAQRHSFAVSLVDILLDQDD